MGHELDLNILNGFITESIESLEDIEEKFVTLEHTPGDIALIDSIFRSIHSIKGGSAFLGLENIKECTHKMENLLDELRAGKRDVTKGVIDILLEGADLVKNIINQLAVGENSNAIIDKEKGYFSKLDGILYSKKIEEDITIYFNEIDEVVKELESREFWRDEGLQRLINLITLVKKTIMEEKRITQEEQSNIWILYHLKGLDVTKYINYILKFFDGIDGIKQANPTKEQKDGFLTTMDNLIALLRKNNINEELDVISKLKEDFIIISNGLVGFDSLLVSILKKDFMEFVNRLEKKDISGVNIKRLGDILVDSGKVSQKDLENAIEEQKNTQKRLGDILYEQNKITKEELASAMATQKRQVIETIQGERKGIKKTMRIEEEKIDEFMNYVGELIVAGEVYNYVYKNMCNIIDINSELKKNFKDANLFFDDISNMLQASLMDVRRVSIKVLFQKLPRVVRELSKRLVKRVDLILEGEDCELDKSLLEAIADPIIHIIRNAMDHGFETPNERIASGKEETGKLIIKARQDETYFYLTIEDDGRGIDPQKIKEIALKKGLISQERYNTMSDIDAINTIFMAGVSTSKDISEISGRGVGMDVVMVNITKMNGTIAMDSEKGKGTKISIKLPLAVTLTIIDGLVVKVGTGYYIIPLDYIKESWRPKRDDIVIVNQTNELVNVRGEFFPLVRLHNLFNVTPKRVNPWESLVVAVEYRGIKCCLLIDSLVSQQQVVLKNLGKRFKNIKEFKGGSILGDGNIGLVLNVEHILFFLK